MPKQARRWLDAVITGGAAYALLLGWSACSGGAGSGGGFVPEGGLGGAGNGGAGGWLPSAQAQTSGARLKARRLVGADGSKQFEGWFDSARNENCAFWHTVEGKRRCLPSGPVESDEVSEYFADPGCTVPAVRGDSKCAPPKYGILYQSADCGALRAAEVRAVSGGQVPLHYRTSTGGCEVDSNDIGYPLGDVIPWDSFLEAGEQTDP